MSFNPNAYGKPPPRSQVSVPLVRIKLENTPARSAVSSSLLDSRWSKYQNELHKTLHRRGINNDEDIPSGSKKREGNVVVQSVSLQSSPRQTKAQANNQEHVSDSQDITVLSTGCDGLAHDLELEISLKSRESSQKSKLPTTNSDGVELKFLESDLHSATMPVAENEVADQGDQLRALQQVRMLQISQKVEGQRKRGKGKLDTVRLEDLYLARRPVDASDPSASVRTWVEDAQLPQDGPSRSNNHAEHDEQKKSTSAHSAEIVEKQKADSLAADKRAQRWPSKADMRPEKAVTDENAWGSDVSDDTRANNSPDHSYGKLFNKKPENGTIGAPLGDWNGNFMPPPADWHDRPRFNNNSEEYKDGFDSWLSVARQNVYFSNGLPVCILSKAAVEDVHNYPDGISMVDKKFRIGFRNLIKYGYDFKDPDEKASLFEPIDIEFKREKENPAFAQYKNETTEILVANWLKHRRNAQQLSIDAGLQAPVTSLEIDIPTDDRSVPELNIYLRPATETDLQELVRIYNLHVEHGVAPIESFPIVHNDMLSRMDQIAKAHLPFIVAAKMSQKDAHVLQSPDNEAYSGQRRLPVQHQQRQRLSRVEILAGFACANSLTCADYIDRTSAELEVYVDPVHKRKGVGRCLLDKLLQICDRGHSLTTNCNFHCAPDVRHLYESGGDRDLHKLYLLYRKWHMPKPVSIQIEGSRKHRKLPMKSTSEDDYNIWLKDWIESFDFEVEGLLKKTGAKNGRYIDLVYFGRETLWQPPDGHVPPPDPRLYNSTQVLEEEEEEEEEDDDDDDDEEEEGVAI